MTRVGELATREERSTRDNARVSRRFLRTSGHMYDIQRIAISNCTTTPIYTAKQTRTNKNKHVQSLSVSATTHLASSPIAGQTTNQMDPTKQETEDVFKVLKGQKANKVSISRPDTSDTSIVSPSTPAFQPSSLMILFLYLSFFISLLYPGHPSPTAALAGLYWLNMGIWADAIFKISSLYRCTTSIIHLLSSTPPISGIATSTRRSIHIWRHPAVQK